MKDLGLLKVLFKNKMEQKAPRYLKLVTHGFNDKDVDGLIDCIGRPCRDRTYDKWIKSHQVGDHVLNPETNHWLAPPLGDPRSQKLSRVLSARRTNPGSRIGAGAMPESIQHGCARLCSLQRASPPKHQQNQSIAPQNPAYEPGGRGFESCRARHKINGLRERPILVCAALLPHCYPLAGLRAEGVDAEYLLDDKLRLHLGMRRDACPESVVKAIDKLRDELAQPGKILRLVGVSGVGKTRLVQALFDARIGSHPLPPSFAVYTNLSDNPDPQPTGLASDLIANRTRAVLIVDNCPPDLHRRLSELCSGQISTLSVLTVEFDVRDDQPEGTRVVTLDTSSPELIEKIVRRRYSHLSQVDAHTIAEASGGNARIAIALAETVERSETIAGLSDDELFQRLFRQRHEPNDALLRAAQACSLVYSFQGEALAGEEAELPRLAALAGQAAEETYGHVGELLRRDLVQERGVWRAVLPHAIANRLAARALEDTPYDLITQQLIDGRTERLVRSFSRRLSFLHDHPKAVAIVQRWLASDGLLGNVTALSELGRAMLENVAPVVPEAVLAAMERVANRQSDVATMLWRHRSLLRSLAYDQPLFERSAQLLARAVTQSTDEQKAQDASGTFVSLFTLYLSGTHATIEQRLGLIERLLRSGEAKAQVLGLAALDKILKVHFSSSYGFDFGARSRDHGYRPRSNVDISRWYGAALKLIERLALTEGVLEPELRHLLARSFRGLWTSGHIHGELERLFRRFATDGFWREGWAACGQTMQFDRRRLTPEAASRLSALKADLGPQNLPERVQAIVLGFGSSGLDPDDVERQCRAIDPD